MKRVVVILLLAVFAVVGLAAHNTIANGQEKKAASTKLLRWDGHIVRLDNDAMYMDVRDKSGTTKRIHWDSATVWSKINKPVTDRSEFKVEERVICVGKPDEKGDFLATKIDLRVHP
jgi:nitrogen fixation protein FixH